MGTDYLDDDEITNLLREEDSLNYGFHQLVIKYQERLYWHIRRITLDHSDADDVLQETFIKVWKGIPKFRGESSLFTWLYRISTNEALAFLRKKKRNRFISFGSTEHNLGQNLVSDPELKGDKIQLKLQQAILKLPEKQRIVFNLKYFEEMKYEDMSKVLDTSVGALKASYHHAVKKIEAFLKHQD